MSEICLACGEFAYHYVSSVGHLTEPEHASEPYYRCRPDMSAWAARSKREQEIADAT